MGTKKSKLVVTGMGAVTPIGCGVNAYWNNLINGVCGIDRISRFDADMLAVKIAGEVKDFDVAAYMPKKVIHETDAFTQYAYVAAKEALGESLPAAPERVGIVMGTAMAGVSTTAETQELLTNAVHKNVGPKVVPRVLGNIAAAQIAIAYGIYGPSSTISTACASGGRCCVDGCYDASGRRGRRSFGCWIRKHSVPLGNIFSGECPHIVQNE